MFLAKHRIGSDRELVTYLKNVITEYPETFPLTGEERIFFDYRLKKMFRRGRLEVATLDSLRAQLGITDPDTASQDDLRGLDYDDFEEMPEELLYLLPPLVGTYLGVRLHAPIPIHCDHLSSTRRAFPGDPSLSGHISEAPPSRTHTRLIALSALTIVSLIALITFEREPLSAASRLKESIHAFAVMKQRPQSAGMKRQAEEILNATLSTSNVRTSLNRLGAAVKTDGTIYKVHVTITHE